MTPNRKKTQEYILTYIDKIAPGGKNKELYVNLFKSMSDSEFDMFMSNIRDKKVTLSIIVPHDSSVKVSVANNFKIGKQLGYSFFQRIRISDPITNEVYLTPNKYLIYRLPVKRTSQLLTKGISIPKDGKRIDMLTGQVAASSRAVKLTMPETQMLVGMGLNDTLVELLKYRGGDLGSKNAMVNILYNQGNVDAKTLDEFSTGVEGTKTLRNYFLGAHIKPTNL